MPCSICRCSGHNKSTCYFRLNYNLNNNRNYEDFLNSSTFYTDNLKTLINMWYGIEDEMYSRECHIDYFKSFIVNYRVFNKKKVKVINKNKLHDNCVICMDKCQDISSCYQCFQCQNVVHSSCCDKWFESNQKKTCPSCRVEWGEKKKAPLKYGIMLSEYINNYKDLSEKIETLDKLILNTLQHYLLHTEFEIDQNLISRIPFYIQEKIFYATVLQRKPIIANGTNNIFEL